ncbi:unnamed protein product, partial [Iphiclides podalirius]
MLSDDRPLAQAKLTHAPSFPRSHDRGEHLHTDGTIQFTRLPDPTRSSGSVDVRCPLGRGNNARHANIILSPAPHKTIANKELSHSTASEHFDSVGSEKCLKDHLAGTRVKLASAGENNPCCVRIKRNPNADRARHNQFALCARMLCADNGPLSPVFGAECHGNGCEETGRRG